MNELRELEELINSNEWPIDLPMLKVHITTLFAANREQRAEIERLKIDAGNIEGILSAYDYKGDSREKLLWLESDMLTAQRKQKMLEAQLASLRASAGEKWIEVKEGCEVPEYGETIHAICTSGAMEPWQEVFEATFTMGWEEMAACGVTYWKRLKWPVAPPPTLPGEEK